MWNLLLRIFTGDVTPPPVLKHGKSRGGKRKTAVKTVNSAVNFTTLGSIEDDVLIPLLTDVVNGHSS